MGTQDDNFTNGKFTHFYEILDVQKTSYILNTSAPLAAGPVFVSTICHFCLKNGEMGLIRQCFYPEAEFLTHKYLPRLAPLAGGNENCLQILPLHNLYISEA